MNIFGQHDRATIAQLEKLQPVAHDVALMADGHVGYVMPIGGVAAYRDQVCPIGVGVDIACGNAAVRTNVRINQIAGHLEQLADAIYLEIAFGPGGKNPAPDAPRNHSLFEADEWDLIPAPVRGNLRDQSRAQLGTIGGGNHFVDVFHDDEGFVWVGVHFGSRALGFNVAHGMVLAAQGGKWNNLRPKPDMNTQTLLSTKSQLGQDYLSLMLLAGSYAYAGRDWVCDKVVQILTFADRGVTITDRVHNNHNFAWEERHDGQDLIVVRKGATPAGRRGFIGGTMASHSVIMSPQPYDRRTLGSTVHGAGRVMGRNQATGKWKRGECVRPGAITAADMAKATENIVLRGGDLDEAPQAYRDLGQVLVDMNHTQYIEHVLTPVIVCMAPSRTGALDAYLGE